MVGKAGTNFSVLRMTRDVLRRSRIGFIGTARSPSESGLSQSFSGGTDAQFQLYENVNINAYYARTSTEGREGDQSSYRGRYDWNADRYGVQTEYLSVGEDFNPEVGFLRRSAFRRSYGLLRFSPRPKQPSAIRKVFYEASLDYITGPGTKLETREAQGTYRLELNNGDFASAEVTRSFEGLLEPFNVGGDVVVPVGNYSFTQTKVSYQFGPQRPVNGNLDVTYGGFFDGTLTAVAWRGRVEMGAHFLVEPTLVVQPRRAALGRLHHEPAGRTVHLDDDQPPLLLGADAVPVCLEQPHHQRALPLGVHPRQRALRRI